MIHKYRIKAMFKKMHVHIEPYIETNLSKTIIIFVVGLRDLFIIRIILHPSSHHGYRVHPNLYSDEKKVKRTG